MKTLNCSAKTLVAMSELCLTSPKIFCSVNRTNPLRPYCDEYPRFRASCFPFEEETSLAVGLWCLANAGFGFSGNLLTLLAIPHAKRHQRFGFERDWRDPTTLFILNLALSDLLYCVINLPLYAVQFFSGRWPWGASSCVASAAFRYVNAFADWMSLALIALRQVKV